MKKFFDFSATNPQCTANHVAVYCGIYNLYKTTKSKEVVIENSLKEQVKVLRRNTFVSVINDLCEWGFLRIVQLATNQFSKLIVEINPKCCIAGDTANSKCRIVYDTAKQECCIAGDTAKSKCRNADDTALSEKSAPKRQKPAKSKKEKNKTFSENEIIESEKSFDLGRVNSLKENNSNNYYHPKDDNINNIIYINNNYNNNSAREKSKNELQKDEKTENENFSKVEIEKVAVVQVDAVEVQSSKKNKRRSTKKNPAEYTIVHQIRLATEELSPGYFWRPKDAVAAKGIVEIINFKSKSIRGVEASNEEIIETYRRIIKNLHKTFLGKGWDVSSINCHLEKIWDSLWRSPNQGVKPKNEISTEELLAKMIDSQR